MRKLGRPPGDLQLTVLQIRLTEDIRSMLDMLSLDPLTARLQYGKRNALVEHALIEYFAKHYPRKEIQNE